VRGGSWQNEGEGVTRVRRKIRTGAALVAFLLLPAACGGGGTTAGGEQTAAQEEAGTTSPGATEAGTGAETATVRFAASAPPSSIALMADIIEGEGLDEKHGLDLEFSEFAPDAAEQALLTGQVDAGFFAIVSLAKVRAEGQDIAFLAPIQTNHGAVIVSADSDYQSLEDLQGQKVATLSPVSGLYTSMQVLAAEVGLDWAEDFEVISGPPPGLVAFLEGGDVEAIVHFEPTVSSLLAGDKYRVVMTPAETWQETTGSPLLMLGLAASQQWIDDNPDVARRLAEMMQETTQLMSSDTELLGEYLANFDLSPEVVEIAKERMAQIYIPDDPSEVEETARLILDRSKELGIIDEVPDPVFVTPEDGT
jgi:ABC-type nitrate/sulfonate/bicarbonate transport system substrate-binding protein